MKSEPRYTLRVPRAFAKNFQPGDDLVPKWILGTDNVLRKHYVRPEELTQADPVTQEVYRHAPTVLLDVAARAVESRMFQGPLDDATWGRLVGGISGSIVEGAGRPGLLDSIAVSVNHPWFDELRRNLYHFRSNGVMVLDNEAIYKNDDAPYKYLGLRMVGTQILTAQRVGLDLVQTYGSGHGPAWGPSSDIGYYYWPFLGFDGDLQGQHPLVDQAVSLLQRDYGLTPGQTPSTIQELLVLPSAREWWKQHGGPLELTFVLDPTGAAVTNMLGYLREEGIWLA
jgi:hypothetical protein